MQHALIACSRSVDILLGMGMGGARNTPSTRMKAEDEVLQY